MSEGKQGCTKAKKRFGDRKDGRRIRKTDAMHKFMPYLLPGRIANEAVINEDIPVQSLVDYVAQKNAASPDFKYTVFHAILAAAAKTIYMRPKMNYFYQGHRLYERNEISFAFTAKRTFEDKSEEALAIFRLNTESDVAPIEQIHEKIARFINKVRKEDKNDGATDIMDTLTKLPRFLIKFVVVSRDSLLPIDYFAFSTTSTSLHLLSLEIGLVSITFTLSPI